MKLTQSALSAITLVLVSLSGCDRNSKRPKPKTVTVELSPEANLSEINAGDTIVFQWKQAVDHEYWVFFKSKTPCQGEERVLQSQRGRPPQCVVKSKLDSKTDYIFKFGEGTPPIIHTDTEEMVGGIICRPWCE